MQHRHTRKSAVRLAGAALAAALSLGLAAAASADQLQDILAAKKLRVAIDLGVPPYGMKDAALKSTGSDVETARLLAQDLGVELEIVPTTGANRVPFLQTNKADIVISSMSITPERQKVVDFSVPYAAILAVVGAPRSMTLTSAADLANKKVIATRGTTNDAELTKIAPKDAQIIRFDDDATSITAVVSGQADIFATAPALLRTINDKAPAKQMESKFVMRLNMLGIGLRKNEPALKARLDGWVRDNLQNGKLNAVYKEFHGVNLPPEVQGPAAERPEATMARIASVDIFLVDLLPRSCAPTRCRASSGRKRPSCASPTAMARSGWATATPSAPAARPWRACWTSTWRRCCRAARPAMWRVVARADVPGARHHGGRADLDRAGRHRHGAVGPARAPRRPAVAPAGRRRQDRIPLYTTEGGWLHLPTEALVEARCRPGRKAFMAPSSRSGGPMWPRTWRASPPCARPWATTGTSWWTPTRAFGARGDPPRARLRASGHCLAGRADPRRRRARAPAAVGLDHGADRGGRVAVQPVAVQDYLQSDACSVVQVDVGRIGGITPWLKVAHMAEAYNVPVCPHFLMEIHVALCCAVPNSRWLEYIPQLDLITQSGMRIEDGHGVPSQAPGLGIDWDWAGIERLARHRSRHG